MYSLVTLSVSVAFIVSCSCAELSSSSHSSAASLNEVSISLPSLAVLGQNATFRQNSRGELFNPTNTSPPFFQIFHPDFLAVLGTDPTVRRIAINTTFASGFAYEAPVYNPPTNEIFFVSEVFPPESSFNHSNRISKINLTVVEEAIVRNNPNINVPFETLSAPDTVQITNGGTGPLNGSLLLATRGRGNLPASLVLVNTDSPNNATVLLDNFFGRQFNSMNDLKIHPSGNIFFTDDNLGFTSDQKPAPLLPSQVYMFNPHTGLVKMVADGFSTPNGIAFGPGGTVVYIGDSAGDLDQTLPATVYAYDVDAKSFMFNNRRVFAFIDAGAPDGIQVDTDANVYIAGSDGVEIFREDGVLLGKVFVGSIVANMAFAGDGRLVILSNTTIYLAQIAAKSALVSM